MNNKIALLTIYDLANFGNRLQNYASVVYLEQQGYIVHTMIVDCMTVGEAVKRPIKKILRKKIYREWNLTQENPERVQSLSYLDRIRYDNFRDFTYKYIPPKYVKYIAPLPLNSIHKYTRFFIGSDQVWNPEIAQARDWEFLRFVPRNKRVAWIASFGVDQITQDQERIARNLNEMEYLSVREEAGVNIIKELTGRDAELLIDPTLLLDAADWDKIAEEPKKIDCKGKYILTYFLGRRSERVNKELEKYKNKGFMIYNLCDKNQPDVYILNPAHFLFLVAHARLVMTDSFHACVFSFLYDKPFIVYPREGNISMMSRLDTLLSKFNLQRKYVDSGLSNDIFEHDYSKGKKILEYERKKVKKFLSKALNIKAD